MTPWNAFFDLLSPDVPGCTQAAQVIALRQAAITFCEQSLAWKYEHPDIDVISGTAQYLFDPPAQTIVHAVTSAEFNDELLEIKTMERNISKWTLRLATGIPEYLLGGPVSVTLVPMPDVSGTLKLNVALKPSPTGDGVDDKIYDEYREAVVHGALSKLLLSPKKPYTDMTLANYHAQLFHIQTACAGMREAKTYNRAPLETSMRRL